jgi:hypothetical protein
MPRRLIGLATVSFLVAASLWPTAVGAGNPHIALTLTASPNPAAASEPLTFTGTATPVGGTWNNVGITVETVAAQSCSAPGGSCNWDVAHAFFTYPALTSKVTFSLVAPAAIGRTVRVSISYCEPDCLGLSASVTIQRATLSAGAACSPSGTIQPGATLHCTVTGTTNAGPIDADVQTKFVAGLADPTGLSPGAVWSPAPYRYIDYGTTLDLSASYVFDAKVTAAAGSSITIVLNIFPVDSSNGSYTRTISFPVGSTSPTPPPPPVGTPRPVPVATPTPEPTPTPSESENASISASPSESPTASGSGEESGEPSASAAASPSASPSADSQTAPPAGFAVLLGSIAVVGVAGTGIVLWRRRVLHP